MSTELLEAKISDLTRRLESLEADVRLGRGKGWEGIAGRARHDDLMDEAMKLGAEWRTRANTLPPDGPFKPAPSVQRR